MLKKLTSVAAVLMLSVICGCSSSGSSSSASTEKKEAVAAEPAKPKIPIPADSPFAKLKPGMGYDEVTALIGRPTSDPIHYQTGKAWIPYNFGGDKWRIRAHYKGIGALTFSSNSSFTGSTSLMPDGIDYNPEDPGFDK